MTSAARGRAEFRIVPGSFQISKEVSDNVDALAAAEPAALAGAVLVCSDYNGSCGLGRVRRNQHSGGLTAALRRGVRRQQLFVGACP